MKRIESAGILASLVAAALLAASPAAAQSAVYGTIMGKLIDSEGKPIVGAVITFKHTKKGVSFDIKTDKRGEFYQIGVEPNLAAQPDDLYEVTIKRDGEVIHRAKVKVYGGQAGDPNEPGFRNTFNWNMSKAPGQQSEEAKKKQEASTAAKSGYDRAVLLNREGKHEEALAELQALLDKAGNQWVVHHQMAVAYTGLGRNEEAEAAFKKAIELNPNEGGLHSALGQLYLKMNRSEEAKNEFQVAAELSPENAAIYYYNLGVTLYNSGDLKAAAEPFRQAAELDPSRPESYYFLGMCLFSQAQYKSEGTEVKIIPAPGTREAFEQYLALAPNGQYAAEAKAALESIGASVSTSVRVKKK
jgi:tetratricopeptide (TPR) repeat protein